jgi:hypothetical protein
MTSGGKNRIELAGDQDMLFDILARVCGCNLT